MAKATETAIRKRASSTSNCAMLTRKKSRVASERSCANMTDLDGDYKREDVLDTVLSDTQSQEYFDALSQPAYNGKGKGKMADAEVEDKPFPIMSLPTEIRLEIYRACLTRPYKILLSKVVEQAPYASKEAAANKTQSESDSNEESDDQDAANGGTYPPFSPIETRRSSDAAQTPASVSAGEAFANLETRMRQQRNGRQARLRPSELLQMTTPPTSGSSNTPPTSNLTISSVASEFSTINVPAPLSIPVTNAPNGDQSTAPQPGSRPGRSNRRVVSTSPGTAVIPIKPKSEDPLIVNLLRTSKEIYKEARDVMYGENVFDLDINTAVTSLAALHQRSRRHIKHVELEIPTYTEILERFSEVVRLSLRYCSGLKKFVIHTPFTLPHADNAVSASNTTVYANGFDILRWLPQQCQVVLEGNENKEIEAVVEKHLALAKMQDKVAYARRQLISNDAERPYAG